MWFRKAVGYAQKHVLCLLSEVATQVSKKVKDHLFIGGKHCMDTKRVKGHE